MQCIYHLLMMVALELLIISHNSQPSFFFFEAILMHAVFSRLRNKL